MALEIPIRTNNRMFLNADKNGQVLKHLPILSREDFIRIAPPRIEGAGSSDGVVYDKPAFISLRSRPYAKDCVVFVSSPGNYTKNILESGSSYVFEDCTFLIDEGADIDWLSLQLINRLEIKGKTTFYKVLNPHLSRTGDVVPSNCVCSGNRQVLFYFHYGIQDRIQSISRMQGCAKAEKNQLGYDVILPSGLVSKRDYIAAYVWLRGFLDYHGMSHLYSSPLDNFPRSLFTDALMLPTVKFPKYK